MPFTFAHPAAVLPAAWLPSRYVCMSALIVGTLTPDFEYYLRVRVMSVISHTTGGLFWFCVPAGLLALFIFHNIVRDTLIENLPLFLRSRFNKYKNFNFNAYFKNHWLVVLLCLLAGAFTHQLWDGFTHAAGNHAAFMLKQINLFGYPVGLFKIFQHLSSLFGLAVIALFVYKMPADKDAGGKIDIKYWVIFLLIAGVFVAAKASFGFSKNLLVRLMVTANSGCLLALVFTPIIMKILKAIKRPA
ncbi:hypothetical protein Dip510_001315 [Elusimicrobium posterum]|uniref:DUF4184 family protein n=1 Tax=Elusimicrobium posterum TaxID=3116653 RepID=UPI003C753478